MLESVFFWQQSLWWRCLNKQTKRLVVWHYNIKVKSQPWRWLFYSTDSHSARVFVLVRRNFALIICVFLLEQPMKAMCPSKSLSDWFNEIIPLESCFETDLCCLCACPRNACGPMQPELISFFPTSNFEGSLLLHVWQWGGDDSFSTSVFLQSVKLPRCLINVRTVWKSPSVFSSNH